MAWHDSTSEMGGWGSRTGFEPRFTSELQWSVWSLATGCAPRFTCELGGVGSHTGFAPRLMSESGRHGLAHRCHAKLQSDFGVLNLHTGLAPSLPSEHVGRSSHVFDGMKRTYGTPVTEYMTDHMCSTYVQRGQCVKQSNMQDVDISVQ